MIEQGVRKVSSTLRRNVRAASRRGTARMSRLWVPVLVLVLLLGAVARPAGAQGGESRVLPQLQREAAAAPAKTFRVIVTRIQNNKAGDQQVAASGGQKLKDLPHNAFVAELPGRAIEALGRNTSVKYVAPDAPMLRSAVVEPNNLATLYPRVVNASGLWSSLTGAGVGVAVLDTGVRSGRADWLDAAGASRVKVKVRFSSSSEYRTDGHGHGTHVAGIIAGNSWHRIDPAVQGKYVGVAPEANLVDVKVSDDIGRSYVSDVVTAIDWVIQNRERYNIRVMNLSLVSSTAESAKTSVLAAAVERAWFNGIFVAVAAGNVGPNTVYYPPANDPFVVTVGASDSVNTVARGDDGMAPWSSYGTTQDAIAKPDVVAPGRYIVAPLASTDATLAEFFPSRVVDTSYMRLSGTSMSAPVVAGVAALAFQAHPEWTNNQVKWLLQQTATKLGAPTAPLPGQGAGLVDAAAVVAYTGTPQQANQNLPINEQLVGPNGETVYSTASSWSASSWSASSWSASSWSASSWSASSWSASNFSTSTWSSLPDEEFGQE